IYFLVPAGVVIYMIVSSAIRVLTQDLIFRYGLVNKPAERQVGGTQKPSTAPAAVPARSTSEAAQEGTGQVNGERRAFSFGGRRSGVAAGRQSPRGGDGAAATRGRGTKRGSTNGTTATTAEPKAHPRAKAKRARKAR
ncbi:MAG: hypothetical protein ACRDL8_03985, partial [Solirubrobacteraceae bacterium]